VHEGSEVHEDIEITESRNMRTAPQRHVVSFFSFVSFVVVC